MADQDVPGAPEGPAPVSAEKAGLAARVKAPFSAASHLVDSGVRGLANLVKLEVVVTTVCFFVPFILLYGDGWNTRPHISAYYAMEEAQYFYFPLTVAAMLFVVNGLVKERHWYNVGLGAALSGVVLFNHVDYSLIHNISAAGFFLGNAVVFVVFTPREELWFKIALAAGMIVGLLGHFAFDWYSLFVAETLSLWVIAVHFLLEAKGLVA